MLDNIRKKNYILEKMTQSFKGYLTGQQDVAVIPMI